MKFKDRLLQGTLVKRYKRFFVDINYKDKIITAHCPNTGSMMGLLNKGNKTWFSESSNPKRKLKYSLEIIRVGKSLVGINTLLANIMVYVITKTFNSASWIYYGRREEGGRFLPKDFHRIETPTAAALFPAEMLSWPPRSYAERMYNIKRWTKMPKGGHFAALEQPELLIDDIRAFARTLR